MLKNLLMKYRDKRIKKLESILNKMFSSLTIEERAKFNMGNFIDNDQREEYLRRMPKDISVLQRKYWSLKSEKDKHNY